MVKFISKDMMKTILPGSDQQMLKSKIIQSLQLPLSSKIYINKEATCSQPGKSRYTQPRPQGLLSKDTAIRNKGQDMLFLFAMANWKLPQAVLTFFIYQRSSFMANGPL